MSVEEMPDSVWMQGAVNSVMAAHNMVNISHEPVEAWNWPEMTMDFMVSDSVDINRLADGQTLHFEVTKGDDDSLSITAIHIMEEPQIPSATVDGVINHIDLKQRILNISRGPIEKWNRGAATMDFVVADGIDLSELKTGDNIKFTFEVHDDLFITELVVSELNHSEHLNSKDSASMSDDKKHQNQDHSHY